jgi:hypothetical protein
VPDYGNQAQAASGYSPPPGYTTPGYSAPGHQTGYPGDGLPGGGSPAGQSIREQLSSAQQKLPGHLPRIPLELLGVCGVMALSGLLLLWPSLTLLGNGFPILGDGSVGLALGLLAIDIGVIILAFAAALLLLAWRLSHGDRVARGLSYVMLGAIAFAVLVGGDHSVGLIIVMLLSLACIAVLALVPAVKQFFTGPNAPHGGESMSVTMVRTLLTWFAGSAIFLGATFLPMGAIGAQMIVAGLVFIGVGIGVFVLSSRLAQGEPTARLITTGLTGAYALLALIGGGRNTATLLDLAIAGGIVCLLWLPEDAKRHFAQSSPPVQSAFTGSAFGGPGYGGQASGSPAYGGPGYGSPGYGAQPDGGAGQGSSPDNGYGGAGSASDGYGGAGYGGNDHGRPESGGPGY